ncbi:hypothetical protein D3C71_1996860 [compost metagenome]
MVSSKSASVSPGKPTMKSPDNARSGWTARMRAISARYSAAVCLRFIAFRIRSEPDCTGKCR